MNYSNNAFAVTAYGAPMGRPSIHLDEPNAAVVLTVSHVEVDDGGYDANGTYFGLGKPLFWVTDEEGTVDFMVRGWDQEEVLETVRRLYPNATFQHGQDIECESTMEEEE